MKAMKKILSTCLAVALAVTCLIVPSTSAKADTVIPYDANGFFLGTSVTDYDVVDTGSTISFSGPNTKTVYVNKLRMYAPDTIELDDGTSYKWYPEATLSLYTSDAVPNYEIVSVKANKKGLKCKIGTKSTYSYKSSGKEYHYDSSIGLKATKAGTYTVTVTLKLEDGRTVKTSATVLVPKKNLDVTFPGTEFSTNNTFKAKSVKVKVKPGTKMSGIKLYYRNTNPQAVVKQDEDSFSFGTMSKWYKIKNGGKVKLKSNTSYTLNWNYSKDYTYSTYTWSETESHSEFYPSTDLNIVYKDSFYGVTVVDSSYSLYKYKKY